MAKAPSSPAELITALEIADRGGKLSDADRARLAVLGTRGKIAGVPATPVTVREKDPTLEVYRKQYNCMPSAAQVQCSWEEVKARLLGNSGQDLERAGNIPGGQPVLFGVDKDGNPLIANGGPGPILTGMNYANTRKAVHFAEKDGKPVPTGYEMLSEEVDIRTFEAFTGKPVVQLAEGQDWAGIWRESGDNPGWARSARVYAGNTRANLYEYYPGFHDPGLGVRCLLRVLKKS